MKKTYQIPSTDLMLINVENLLQAGSPTLPKNDTEEVTNEDELLGRQRRDVWDEEEEEEEY